MLFALRLLVGCVFVSGAWRVIAPFNCEVSSNDHLHWVYSGILTDGGITEKEEHKISVSVFVLQGAFRLLTGNHVCEPLI